MTGSAGPVELSAEHIEAVNRQRRVVINFDALLIDPDEYESVDAIVQDRFCFTDDPATCIDSIWWNWCEGNVVPYLSKFLPRYNVPGYKKWYAEGIDIVRIFREETHKRGLEAFYSHRMNGGDNDPQYREDRGTYLDDTSNPYQVPLKLEHPEWLIEIPWGVNRLWNLAFEGVREYILRNLREIAEDYGFDGIELDFARMCPVLPPGHGWENRQCVTALIRSLRAMTLEVERQRGRPFLLAARVPENLMGCHFDGMDVEAWARDRLVDIFTMGCRNFDVDVGAFRRITEGTQIKLYCVLDDHHSSDGYCAPPIEVLRGVLANWYRQGADGVQTFNFKHAPDPGELHWDMHQQAYREFGDPEKMHHLDTTFVVNRRGGGHGAAVIPYPEDWSTPRLSYSNSNMFGQLPAALANDGKADTLVRLFVGDDVNGEADRVSDVILRVLLNDPGTGDLPDGEKLARAMIRELTVPKRDGGPGPDNLYNRPPVKGIEAQVEVRINNILLDKPIVEEGWLVFRHVGPEILALGENLLGLRVMDRAADVAGELLVEKIELDVTYR